MFCTSCGAYIKDEYRFCNHCGAPRPVMPQTKPGSRAIPLVITALMFLFGLVVYLFSQFGG